MKKQLLFILTVVCFSVFAFAPDSNQVESAPDKDKNGVVSVNTENSGSAEHSSGNLAVILSIVFGVLGIAAGGVAAYFVVRKNGELKEAEHQIEEKETVLQDKNKKLEIKEMQLSNANSDAAEAKVKLKQLEEAEQSLRDEINARSQREIELEASIKSLNMQNEEVGRALEQKSNDLVVANDKLKKTELELEDAKTDIALKADALAKYNIEMLNEQLKQADIIRKKETMQVARKAISKKNAVINERNCTIANQAAAIEEARGTIAAHEASLKEAQEIIDEQNDELNGAKSKIAAQAEDLAKANSTIAAQTTELANAKNTIAAKEIEKEEAVRKVSEESARALEEANKVIAAKDEEKEIALRNLNEEKEQEIKVWEQRLSAAFPSRAGKFRSWVQSNFDTISAQLNLLVFSLSRLEMLAKEENKRPAFDELVRLDDALWQYFGENSTDNYAMLNKLRAELKEPLQQILSSTKYKIMWTDPGVDVNGDDNYRIVDDAGCVVIITVKAMIYNGDDVVQKSRVICDSVQ